MPWQTWVTTDEAHARAAGRRRHNKQRQQAVQVRRQEVERLLQRWGLSAAAKVQIATLLGVSLRTITRDLHALQARPPLPIICPMCGLPSRLDVDASSLTDDPVELAALEEAMARLIKMEDPEPSPRPVVHPPCLGRPRRNDRLMPRVIPFSG